MKRIHIMLGVDDLQASTTFYTELFGTPPTSTKEDYSKWLLDNPRINFSISDRPAEKGVRHLGIQVENEADLEDLFAAADRAEGKVVNEGHTVCCYARSEKSWLTDPQGIEWELFRTYGASETFNGEEQPEAASGGPASAGVCCAPSEDAEACC